MLHFTTDEPIDTLELALYFVGCPTFRSESGRRRKVTKDALEWYKQRSELADRRGVSMYVVALEWLRFPSQENLWETAA